MKKRLFKVLAITILLFTIGVGALFAFQTSNTKASSIVDAYNQQAAQNNTVSEIKDSVSVAQTNGQAIIDKETAEAQVAKEAITAEATTEASTTVAETKAVTTNTQKEATTVQEVQQTEVVVKEAPVVSGPAAGTALTDDQANSMAYQNASTYAEYVNQVYTLINQERTAAGIPSVSKDNTLTIVAMHRSIENAWMNFMEVSADGHHLRPNKLKASTICSYYNLYGSYGENLGRYQSSPSDIVSGWHNSAAHYSCMTNAKYTKVGVGVAKDSEGYLYWTAIFMD
ncbi:CAP domain-containing protein [[Clostridium] fimetarium]|uniref:Uncharacterized conserved protein YkwD, contains CAP (CSP/antigen 5/PR1) domain n=1 Tax=[Clostridium] fimetarium TaxID=99656 RepID=A0A1I0RVT0_9FIRM|nr:CAP domain-containing protein [[Clostridium] fimetarium]SEW45556.1 Uncharacterized conserved protein YkwD, contains CAP (CSP/antigen 5/PR1) domain [[Clostridium] fimetarium]